MIKNNPIFYKDLLISLNSSLWKNLIIAFSSIYFISFLLILSSIKNDYDFLNLSSVWKSVFQIVWIIQILTLGFIAYIKWLLSISEEKSNKTLDFLLISPISPNKFIFGKFASNLVFILTLFIISVPFLLISLILGWVNFSDILFYLLYSFSYISIFVLFGMFFSSLSKSTIFSIIYGFSAVPAFIFFILLTFWINPDIFRISINSINASAISQAVFPMFLIDNWIYSENIINIFWINFHYLYFHIAFYFLLWFFLFSYLVRKFLRYSFSETYEYSYFWSFLLFLVFTLFTPVYINWYFSILFSFLAFNLFFYLFNLKNPHERQTIKKAIKFFLISFSFWSLFLIKDFFAYNTIILYFLVFLLILSSYIVLRKIFFKSQNPLFNLYFFIWISIFFYIWPLISTNLLSLKIENLSNIIKTSVYKDGIIEYNCKTDDIKKFSENCDWKVDNFYNYLIFYTFLNMILAIFLYKKKRKV